MLDLLVAFLAGCGTVAALLTLTAGPASGGDPTVPPWIAIPAAPIAFLAGRAGLHAARSAVRPAVDMVGVLDHAAVVTHASTRASYRMWHIVVDGHPFEFPVAGAAGTSGLRAGCTVAVRALEDGEVLNLAVDPASRALSRRLPAPAAPPALLARETTLVRRWAWRSLAVAALSTCAIGLILGSIPGPAGLLHAIIGLVLAGTALRCWDAARFVRWALELRAGTPTVLVEGAPERSVGALGGLRVGGRRVECAAPGPGPMLEAQVRGRAVGGPAPMGSPTATLVVIAWVASAG